MFVSLFCSRENDPNELTVPSTPSPSHKLLAHHLRETHLRVTPRCLGISPATPSAPPPRESTEPRLLPALLPPLLRLGGFSSASSSSSPHAESSTLPSLAGGADLVARTGKRDVRGGYRSHSPPSSDTAGRSSEAPGKESSMSCADSFRLPLLRAWLCRRRFGVGALGIACPVSSLTGSLAGVAFAGSTGLRRWILTFRFAVGTRQGLQGS
jgi:hypothetical protein